MSDTPIYDNVKKESEEPGFIESSRKAIVAGVGATLASFGPLVVSATADGVVNFAAEILPAAIISIGLGIGAACATWAIPNAK